jgi:KRAB domain-containing zinc finger protein
MDLVNMDSLSSSNGCSMCGKVFKKKADLEKHASVHCPGRELTCNVCNARFDQLDALKVHVKRHVVSPPLQCDECQKSFASAKNLKVHKARQHPETLALPQPLG